MKEILLENRKKFKTPSQSVALSKLIYNSLNYTRFNVYKYVFFTNILSWKQEQTSSQCTKM